MNNKKIILQPRKKLKLNNYHIEVKTLKFIAEISCLTSRLIKQSLRRYPTLIAGIIQPLLWQILFGALFQKISILHITSYPQFLSSGIIIFTAFSSALNAGLPIMFDREFGFFNRLLVISLVNRFSIVIASICFMASISLIQSFLVMLLTISKSIQFYNTANLLLISLIILLIIIIITMVSLSITFFLPGHIELLALIFVTNLPLLFISTALAPIEIMPRWLQILTSLNPLTYAIESIRYLTLNMNSNFFNTVFNTAFGPINLLGILTLFFVLNFCLFNATKHFFQQKLE